MISVHSSNWREKCVPETLCENVVGQYNWLGLKWLTQAVMGYLENLDMSDKPRFESQP